jgi:hypothetical protein
LRLAARALTVADADAVFPTVEVSDLTAGELSVELGEQPGMSDLLD